MKVWTLSLNGELNGIFDSEEKAIEARRHHLASILGSAQLTVASIGRWEVQ